MKKKLSVVAILAIAAVTPLATTASAGDPELPQYGGKIEKKKNQFFGFDTKGNRIGNFESVNLAVKCKRPKEKLYGSGPLSPDAYRIKPNGTFRVEDDLNPPVAARGTGVTGIKLWIEGKIKANSAKGTIRVKTKGRECDSGVQDWKAKSPSPNRPDPKSNPVR